MYTESLKQTHSHSDPIHKDLAGKKLKAQKENPKINCGNGKGVNGRAFVCETPKTYTDLSSCRVYNVDYMYVVSVDTHTRSHSLTLADKRTPSSTFIRQIEQVSERERAKQMVLVDR